jgi:putative acetyltransferase
MAAAAQRAALTIAPVGAEPSRVALARELFREYEAEIDIDLCFQGFEAEVASLPGAYSPPAGALLLADLAGQVVGCVGLRPLEQATAELKRLYVRVGARGRGIARALAGLHYIEGSEGN